MYSKAPGLHTKGRGLFLFYGWMMSMSSRVSSRV